MKEKKYMDYKKLGKRIREERLKKDITQDQLAEMIESSSVVLSKIESAGKACSLDYLISIANALEVSANTLLADSLNYLDKTSEEVEIKELLSGCSEAEKTFLLRTLKFLRNLLKNYNIK